MKKIIAAALAIIMMCMFCACEFSNPKDFSKAGMTITLTDDFYEKDLISQTAYYESQHIIVTALKEGFELFEEAGIDHNISTKEYAEICITANNLGNITATSGEKYSTFNYQKTVNGDDFSYSAYCFRTSDAFWLIQFACHTKNYDKYKSKFEKYADSVKFD